MFNPFVPFHAKMIDGLLEMNRRYLVSQLHHPGFDVFGEDDRQPILVTDYDDIGLAKIHFNALTDQYRAILDLQNAKHRATLEAMLEPASKYHLYASFIDNMKKTEKRLNDKYSKAIRNYIANHTNWRIAADKTVTPKLQLIFGDLFVILKYSGQEVRFRLTDLDHY